MSVRQIPYRSLVIAAAALGLATVGYAQPQADPPQSDTMMGQHSQMMGDQGTAQKEEENVPPCWREQREWFQKMRQQREEADQRLQSLMEKMNSATGSAKVDAMQAVINELVKQREEWAHWARGWGRHMGYGMGPGMMGWGMGYGSGYGMWPGMMGGYGMEPGPGHPCRRQAPEQGGESSPSGGK